jgi:phosphatidylinositol alpha 1,6-mannosyltransferase
LVHITGPSDIGILGAIVAWDLRVPLFASWHTHLHEFGGRRLATKLEFLPKGVRDSVTPFTEREISCAPARASIAWRA